MEPWLTQLCSIIRRVPDSHMLPFKTVCKRTTFPSSRHNRVISDLRGLVCIYVYGTWLRVGEFLLIVVVGTPLVGAIFTVELVRGSLRSLHGMGRLISICLVQPFLSVPRTGPLELKKKRGALM